MSRGMSHMSVLYSYGIRSLSRSDPFYNRGDKYWTGPIWININYMILAGLKKVRKLSILNVAHCEYQYYMDSTTCARAEQATRVYTNLRGNLIRNMAGEFDRTGYIWEQYNDATGHGQRSRPFAGWSALIVLIVAEVYH